MQKQHSCDLSINQVGYFTHGVKIGIFSSSESGPFSWSLKNSQTKSIVAKGTTLPAKNDVVSGDTVHVADFSKFQDSGIFELTINKVHSTPFEISDTILSPLVNDSFLYFYRTRSGMELRPEIAGTLWARPAGHLSDRAVKVYEQTEDYSINGLGGWYDAGDFGKYVVNGGITVWTLQNVYERASDKKKCLGVLNETRWEMEFLLNMQIPEGKPLAGMAFHKLHDRKWSGVPAVLHEFVDSNSRFAFEPTTAATLNLAAAAAQASRLWKPLDQEFALKCLRAAEKAWKAANVNPGLLAGNIPGEGGGNYDDNEIEDEFYWAAAELFITTKSAEYLDSLTSSKYFKSFSGLDLEAETSFTWADTASLGTISLLSGLNELKANEKERLKQQIVDTADRYLCQIESEGYKLPLAEAGYIWGSNALVLNNGIILALAYDFTKKPEYRDGVVHSMDYILGMNSLKKSFVSGYGVNGLTHPHHRLWANDSQAGFPPPPPGLLAGGPNGNIQDPVMEAAKLNLLPPAKRYLDKIGSFATNEIAINWNAPLFWVAHWLDQEYLLR